jgi:hypothetical protein
MISQQKFYRVELEKLIQEQITRLNENIINGQSAVDYADFKFQVGMIRGFREAIELCDVAETEATRKGGL